MNYFFILFCISQITLASSGHGTSSTQASQSAGISASSSSMMKTMANGYNSAMKSVKLTYQSIMGSPSTKQSSAGHQGMLVGKNSAPISKTPTVSTASLDLSSSSKKNSATSVKPEKTSFTKTISSKAKEVFENVASIDLSYRTNGYNVKKFVSGAVGSILVGLKTSSTGKGYEALTFKEYSINRHNQKLAQRNKEIDESFAYDGVDLFDTGGVVSV